MLSMVQMPPGIPVATFAIGAAGATNAALFAVALLAATDTRLAEALLEYRAERRPRRRPRRCHPPERGQVTLMPTTWPIP